MLSVRDYRTQAWGALMNENQNTQNTTTIDWKRKLTSRKLWMSVATFASMLLVFFNYSESDAAKVAALIMAGATVIGYVIGEGLADSGGRISSEE